MKTRIQTSPGRNYEVRVHNAGKIVWTARVRAQANETTIALPTSQLPANGLISAIELP